MKRVLKDTNAYKPLIVSNYIASDYTIDIESRDLEDIVATIRVTGDDGCIYRIDVDITDGVFPAKWHFFNDDMHRICVDFDEDQNHEVYQGLKDWYSFATAIKSVKLFEPFDDGTGLSDGFQELKLTKNCVCYFDLGLKQAKRASAYLDSIVARNDDGEVIRGREGIAVKIPIITRNSNRNFTVAKPKYIWFSLEEVRELVSGAKKEVKIRASVYSEGKYTYLTYPFIWKITADDIDGLRRALTMLTYYADNYSCQNYVGYRGYGCVFNCSHTLGRRIPDYIIPHESGNSFDNIVKAYEDIYND